MTLIRLNSEGMSGVPSLDELFKQLLKISTADSPLLCLEHAAKLTGLSKAALKKARARSAINGYYFCCTQPGHVFLSRKEVLDYAQGSKQRKARQRVKALRSPLDDIPGGAEWEDTKPAPSRKPAPRSLDDLAEE